MSAPPPPLPWRPSPADITRFVASREALAALLAAGADEGGGAAALAQAKPGGQAPYVGLTNQGSTCYLNSVLQALFHLHELREPVFRWRFDAARHGDAASCIPLQLQRLFARLALSPRAAVGTAGLTRAFGWVGEEAFMQHDAQELFTLLCNALELSDSEGAGAAAGGDGEGEGLSFGALLPTLFRGASADTLTCTACGFESRRPDVFTDIALQVQGEAVAIPAASLPVDSSAAATTAAAAPAPASASPPSAPPADVAPASASPASAPPADAAPAPATGGVCTPYTSLHRALRAHLRAETLEGAERAACGGVRCGGAKTDAVKQARLVRLPPLLRLYLMRFTFDAGAGRAAKVAAPFSFPLHLDADGFTEAAAAAAASAAAAPPAAPAVSAKTAGSGRSAVQALRSLGGAGASDRRASLEDAALAALARGAPLSEEEERAVEELEAAGGERAPRRAAGAAEEDAGAGMVAGAGASAAANGYELSAVLMHSGQAARGHYFAFLRAEGAGAGPIAGAGAEWLLANDTSVLRVTEAEVLACSGAAQGLGAELAAALARNGKGAGAAPEAPSGNAKFVPPGGSAYMLIYRRSDAAASSSSLSSSSSELPPLPEDWARPAPRPGCSPDDAVQGEDSEGAEAEDGPEAASRAALLAFAQRMGLGLLVQGSPAEATAVRAELDDWARLRRAAAVREQREWALASLYISLAD